VNDYSLAIVVGRLTRDPELKYTPQGVAVCSLSVAVNKTIRKEGQEDKKIVSFIDVTAWQRLAELCGQFLKKGRSVMVIGELTQNRWQDKEGQSRSKVEVRADRVQFLDAKEGTNDTAGSTEASPAPMDV
jgi:single-strand DNA-binding protein